MVIVFTSNNKLQYKLLTIMYEFLGLQPPTKKQVKKAKKNRMMTEMYLNVHSESLGVKRENENLTTH